MRAHGTAAGLFAASRFSPDGRELVVAFNTSNATVVSQIEVEATSVAFKSLRGACAARASAPGSFRVEVPPLGYVVCQGAAR